MPPRRNDDPGWLDDEQPDAFVEAIDPSGETLGWMTRSDLDLLRYVPQVIETPERWLKDPWVRNHAVLASQRHLFDGKDLNDVQIVLLASNVINDRRFDNDLRERQFEDMMLVTNPEMWKAYQEKRKQTKENEGDIEVEQRVPGSVEEFLATLATFGEEDEEGRDKEQEGAAEGWLSSILSDDDLSEMGE